MTVPGSSPGVGAAPPADVALPVGRPGRRTWSSWLGEYAGFAPAIVLFGLFFLVPLGLIVCYSFWKTIDYNVVHDWTVDNYHYFFSVPTYVSTVWATVWVSVAATALTLVIAFPFAYWLARYVPKRYQKMLLVLVILPFWTSYLLRVYSWLTILGPEGAINRFLHWTGATSKPVSFFFYDRPAVIFVFIPILGEYLTPQLVGGAKGVMIGNLIVNFFQGAQYTRGAAAALLIAGLIVVLLAVFRRSLEVEDPYGT